MRILSGCTGGKRVGLVTLFDAQHFLDLGLGCTALGAYLLTLENVSHLCVAWELQICQFYFWIQFTDKETCLRLIID